MFTSGWSDREARKLSGARGAELGERSDKLQRGARMPGQRRAGQLVYIYKTVVSDRVLILYRPCAYPGAVPCHASGPTGPRNS